MVAFSNTRLVDSNINKVTTICLHKVFYLQDKN